MAVANYWNLEIEVIKIDESGTVLTTQTFGPLEDFAWEDGEARKEPKTKITLMNPQDPFNLIINRSNLTPELKNVNPMKEISKCNHCGKNESTSKSLEEHMTKEHAVELIKEQKKEIETMKIKLNTKKAEVQQEEDIKKKTKLLKVRKI